MGSRTSRSVSNEAVIESSNLSGRADDIDPATCGEQRGKSQQGPDTKTLAHGGHKGGFQPNTGGSTDNNTHKHQSRESVAEGRVDSGLERPLAIDRYLREGSSSDPEQRSERECFERGRDGMRRYLDHWQQKWNATTKRDNGT